MTWLGLLGLVLFVGRARAALTPSAEIQTDAPVYGVSLRESTLPAVAFNGGRGVAVWRGVLANQWGEYALRYSGTDLTPLDSSPVLLGPKDGYGTPADVACDANQCLVVWDSAETIYGRRIALADGSLPDAEPIVISTASGTRSRARVVAIAGAYFVVWNDGRSSGSYIMGSSVSAAGVVGNPSGTLIAQGLRSRTDVALAENGSGLLAVWTDFRDSAYLVVWIHSAVGDLIGARVTAGGQLPDTFGITIADGATNQVNPCLIWTGSQYALTWY
ncbi:MAG TPA: hypothetical protein VGC79_28395, partial [Polyangiaceae bacterium]